MSTRQKVLLFCLIAWTAFLWVQRLLNAWGSETEATSAKLVSTVLAVVFLGFAAAATWVLVRFRDKPLDRPASNLLVAFAAWTTVVWVVRVVAMAMADHSVGFKVVHAALGAISIALAVAVARPLVRRWSSEPVPG
jgi:hypothetical protein